MKQRTEVSMAIWFAAVAGQQLGPMSLQRLEQLVSEGLVLADSFVWAAGMPEWKRARDVDVLRSIGLSLIVADLD